MFAKKKLKRQDFLFENGWFQDMVKKPGELQMQQFQISDCEECNIYLFDSSACVYIDQCKYCNIFIGASQSSVFIRDCRFLNVICTTQQFRVRDCFQCYFSIFCESQPIIQSSSAISISCFPQFAYQHLQKQMNETKTNPWNNNWFDVYDFTPKKFGTVNFALRPMEQEVESAFLDKIRSKMKQISLKQSKPIIPYTLGSKQFPLDQTVVLVIYPPISSSIAGGVPLIQSRQHRLIAEQLNTLNLNIPVQQGKTSVLFLKIQKKMLQKWTSILPQTLKQVTDIKQLQLYESSVFAPFKDQH